MSNPPGPMTGPPNTAPAGPPLEGRFVVHTDRQGINRLHGGIVAMHTILLVGILALMFWLASLLRDVSWFALLPFGILVVGQGLQIALHAYAWGRRSALAEPMIIEPPGFTMITAAGALQVPWAAVTTVTIRRVLLGRVMFIGVQPAFLAAGPPPNTSFSRRQWRFVQRRGLLLGGRGLQEGLDDIVGAMNHFARRPIVR